MRPRDWVRAGAAVIAIVAPFMTWASVGPISVDGVSNGRDGLVAVIAGGITLALLLLARPKSASNASTAEPARVAIGLLGGAVIAGVAIYDWHKLSEVPTGPFGLTAGPGGGLYLTLAAGLVLIGSAAAGSLGAAPKPVRASAPIERTTATPTGTERRPEDAS